MEDAYEDGADWCSYGWSEDQMAFFPTQKEKWKKLQKIEGHKHDCGRPGINGGYIATLMLSSVSTAMDTNPTSLHTSQLMRESTGLPTTRRTRSSRSLSRSGRRRFPRYSFLLSTRTSGALSKNIKVCQQCAIYVLLPSHTWTHFLACLVFLLGCLLPPLRVTRLGLGE